MCAKFRFSISSRCDDIIAEVKGATLYPQRLAGGAEAQRLPGFIFIHFFSNFAIRFKIYELRLLLGANWVLT